MDTAKLTTEKSHQLLSYSIITAKVKSIFIREKILGSQPIAVAWIYVETKDGVVYLTDVIQDKEQATTAEKLGNSVRGVKKVIPKINIFILI